MRRRLAGGRAAHPLVEGLQQWLTPHRLVAMTFALLVLFIALALLVHSQRSRVDRQADRLATVPAENAPDNPAPPREAAPSPRQGTQPTSEPRRRQKPRASEVFANHRRRDAEHRAAPQDQLLSRQSPKPLRDKGSETVTDSEEMLRIELQTADPNIRIIWFAPRSAESDAPNPLDETR